MQNADSQKVVERFFFALATLKAQKALHAVSSFASAHGINRRHLWMQQQDPSRDIVQLSWLQYLVEDYGVSADWLLTGRGEMLAERN